jgi:hypothetical protein
MIPRDRFIQGFQPQALRAIVSVGVLDQVLLTADRAIVEKAPPNIFVRAACPVVEHFLKVRRETQSGHSITMAGSNSVSFVYMEWIRS